MAAEPFPNRQIVETLRKLGLIDVDTAQVLPHSSTPDAPPTMTEDLLQSFEICSLQDLCVAKLEGLVGLRTCLPILESAQQMLPTDPPWERLRLACERFISNAFDALCENEGWEEVERVLPPPLFAQLQQESVERQKLLRLLKRQGKVLERPSVTQSKDDPNPVVAEPAGDKAEQLANEANKPAAGVAGQRAYPLEWLVAGVAWPTEVEPSKREAYLSVDEFEWLFKMPHEKFVALPAWRKKLLKEQHHLF